MDVTVSFMENSFDGNEDDEPNKAFTDNCDESENYNILDGSVSMTPGKNVQSDTSAATEQRRIK